MKNIICIFALGLLVITPVFASAQSPIVQTCPSDSTLDSEGKCVGSPGFRPKTCPSDSSMNDNGECVGSPGFRPQVFPGSESAITSGGLILNSAVPSRFEITPTETKINLSEESIATPINSEFFAGCYRNEMGAICPTLEEKGISFPIINSGNVSLTGENPITQDSKINVTIQKQVDGAIGIISGGVTVSTFEKITVENSKLFVGEEGKSIEINILPKEAGEVALDSKEFTTVLDAELKMEEEKPIYSIEGTKEVKLLFFIPMNIKSTAKIDATNGDIVSIQKPWWSFLTK